VTDDDTSSHVDRDSAGPAGTAYDWYHRAMALLAEGNPDAAAQLLFRVREEEPTSTSVLEALARALFDAHHYGEAAEAFGELAEARPSDDYAHYGLGMSLWRLQKFPDARDHLAMAFAMRPQDEAYGSALSQVKATIRARSLGGLPLEGPIST